MREQAYVRVQMEAFVEVGFSRTNNGLFRRKWRLEPMTPSPTVMAPYFVNKGRRVDVDEKGTFPELS